MDAEWRCTRCGKVFGRVHDSRLHLSLARGHEFLVGLPVTHACRSCRTLNELTPPADVMPQREART